MKRVMLLLLFCGSLLAGLASCGDDDDRITRPKLEPAPCDTTDSDDD